jgi:predicted transcriptional regulator
MDTQEVHQLTYGDEDLAEEIAAAGVRLPAARVLMFLARTEGATAAEIIRGTDQVSPVVSIALRQLVGQGWVAGRGAGKGTRMMKGWRYSLAWPFDAIMETVHAQTGDGGPAWTRMERGTRHKFGDPEAEGSWQAVRQDSAVCRGSAGRGVVPGKRGY